MTTSTGSSYSRIAAALGAMALCAAFATSLEGQAAHAGTNSIEQNKAMVRRWSEELWSQGNLAVADEIVASDYVRHDPGDPFPARGPEDVKRIVTMLRAMFPDFHIQVEAIVAEGDVVVSR